MADDEQRSRWSFLAVDPKDLVVETFSVVLGIILAVSVGRLIDAHQSHVRMMDALGEIRQEIAADDAKLRERHVPHERVYRAFDAALKRARSEQVSFDTFESTFAGAAPKGFQPFTGATTAWDLARASSVLADVPYTLRAGLQARYASVADLRDSNSVLLGHIQTPLGETRPNFYFAMEAAEANLGDIVATEAHLLDQDQSALDQLARFGVK